MVLTFGAGEHLGDVVQTAHETRTEVEPRSAKRPAGCRTLVDRVQPGAQEVIDGLLEGCPPPSLFPFEPHRHIVIQAQCRSHDVMLLA